MKGWTSIVFFFVGSVPRADRLGNGPYMECFRNHQLEYSECFPFDVEMLKLFLIWTSFWISDILTGKYSLRGTR